MNMLTSKLGNGGSVDEPGLVTRPADADGMPFIRQYLRIAQRWRWAIIGAIIVCLFIGIIVTLLTTPQYTATSTIEISRESAKVTNFEGVEQESSEIGRASCRERVKR